MTKKSKRESCVFHSLESSAEKSERTCKLDEINESINQQFKKRCAFDSFYLYLQEGRKFMASILFAKNKNIEVSQKSGAIQELYKFVFTELEQAGYGKKDEIEIQFALESHEHLNSENKSSAIPSEEDFARAKKLMAERDRNLDVVSRNVKNRFSELCPLFDFFILYQRDVNFRVYVFFNEDKNIEECRKNGIVEDLKDFVYEELERAGRGMRDEITVAFEFDSDENVTANYEGDYYLRLR